MMSMVVLDQYEERTLREKRKATGADRWDEVWDGVYMVMPSPNDEHQEIAAELVITFRAALGKGPKLRAGVNISDRDDDWEHNYREPDVVVFLEGTSAVNRGSYWLGGPEFAVEIISQGDRSRKKLDFYAAVNVRELLLVDRFPWSLELYRLRDGNLELAGRSTIEDQATIASAVLPVSFQLILGQERPTIEIAHSDGQRRWSV